MIFSSKLSSLDQPSWLLRISVSGREIAKSITRGVGGGRRFDTSEKGVVGTILDFVEVSLDLDFVFDCVLAVRFGDRGIFGGGLFRL